MHWATPENIHPSPQWKTLNLVPKVSGFPRRTVAVYAGFKTLLIQYLGEFLKFARFWMVFLVFWSKFTKFPQNSWNSRQVQGAFITGFPMSFMGVVWIFSGIAHCTLILGPQFRPWTLVWCILGIIEQDILRKSAYKLKFHAINNPIT